MELIGRNEQKAIFKHCEASTESKLIAIYGRRRVGKTFLIRKHFKSKIFFEVAGLHRVSMREQLAHFSRTLRKYGWSGQTFKEPRSWFDAFSLLEEVILESKRKTKKVIFLDELPWFDTPRSKFLPAFENFWNSFCAKRTDIICVICGSAASWMIHKIVQNKGGLHNRIAEKIRLTPFTLYETRKFLLEKGIKWSQYDIARLYMITGGIPYYLDTVRKGESVGQCIDRICFKKDGLLIKEYDLLFESLFDDSHHHASIVNALDNKKMGLNRKEIILKSSMDSGGTLSKTLHELEESGFIMQISPFNQHKTKQLYKLVDHFSLFYLKFMKDKRQMKGTNWIAKMNSQSWISWSGLAFERICFAHIQQIIEALQLQAIHCEIYPWKNTEAQIDMIIERSDNISHICEIKFSKSIFTINKSYALALRKKLNEFGILPSNKRKTLFLTMITPFGITQNEYFTELVQNEITLDHLFRSS